VDVLRAIVTRLTVDIHHVIEAAGIIVLGLACYSTRSRRSRAGRRALAPMLDIRRSSGTDV
jgi:hypothetical protein